MEQFIKTYWKTLVFFVVAGLVGGFFTGLFVVESYPEEIKAQIIAELSGAGLGDFPVDILMGIITAMQAAGYGLILGAIGIFLAKQVGLWKDEISITKKPLMITLIVSVVGGLALILPDLLYFGPKVEAIMQSYAVKPSFAYIVGSILYGGVIEEVMLRLFMLSLFVFLLYKIFGKKQEQPAPWMFIVANVVAALLFAAGHLPATFMLIGNSPMIIIRCFLLNGGFGLLFGWLYQKYGLRYAMIAHAGCHIISKLIWILFI